MTQTHLSKFRFFPVIFLAAALIILPCRSLVFSSEEKKQDASLLGWVENLWKKPAAKHQRPVAQFGPISSKDMKVYSENQLKTLSVKIAELDGKVIKSQIIYEQRKKESWKFFVAQSKLEQSNTKDTDKILDSHEKLDHAKVLEQEALEKYRSEAMALLQAQQLAEQCRNEIKKADKMLDFLNKK